MNTTHTLLHRSMRAGLAALLLLATLLIGSVSPALAATAWQIQSVDNNGDLGPYHPSLAYSSLALDSSGNPVISYWDPTNGDLNGQLKLAHCADPTCASGISVVIVDSAGNVGQGSSLVLDGSGNPVISYQDSFTRDLKLAHCADPNCASGTSIVTVDSASSVGDVTSLALGSSGNPVISYQNANNNALQLAHCADPNCAGGTSITIVDNAGFSGQYSSLKLDSSGNPVIAHFEGFNVKLRLAHCADPNCAGGTSITTVGGANSFAGGYPSLELDAAGNPVISYLEYNMSDLKLAHCADPNCAGGTSITTVDSAGDVGVYTSLELDASGNPVISYYDQGNSDLKLAQCADANCAGGTSITIVDGAQSSVGGSNSLKLDSSGKPVISYADYTNHDLKLARLVETDSTPPVISATVTGTLGTNGWYTSDVAATWSIVDNESAISSTVGCEPVSVFGDTSAATFLCTATSAGGTATQAITLKRDATAPALAPVVAPNPVRVGQSASATPNATDALSGVATQSCGTLDLSTPGAKSVSCTATDSAGNSASASAGYTVLPAFPTTGVLDTFNRANGGVGSNWDGLTGSSFYKIAANKLDVQLGGPLVWKPASFGPSQEAFVTLSTIDTKSPSQGLLLKVQTGSIPNGGAISVVYDAKAKAVRVSTLRLGQNGAWTPYANQAATFANGDVLGARANANGTVVIYKNGAQIASVTLNATDQAFFNAKGGKIGLWTAAAPNAVMDDFGGGTVAP